MVKIINKGMKNKNIMKCYKCNKDAKIKYQNGDVCEQCFLEIITKRIKKQIRNESPLQKGQKVLVYGRLAKEFLKRVVEGMPLEIVESKKEFKTIESDINNKYDVVVIPWSADDEANLLFEQLTNKKMTIENIGKNGNVVKIFKSVLDDELKIAARILKIDFEPLSKSEFIRNVHKKYQNAMFGISKVASEFKKATK